MSQNKYAVKDNLGFHIEGEQELNDFFNKSLTWKQQRSVEIATYRRLARPIVRDARTALQPHKKYGTLARSIIIQPFRRKAGLFVGAKKTGQLTRGTNRKTFKGIDGFYAHMVDRGTRGKSGVNFWGPAVTENLNNIGNSMRDAQLDALSKFVNRNLKRTAV